MEVEMRRTLRKEESEMKIMIPVQKQKFAHCKVCKFDFLEGAPTLSFKLLWVKKRRRG